MIYPYTLFLQLVLAGLSMAILVYFIFSKQSLSNPAIKAYFNWFLFFFLYNIFLVLPLLIFQDLGLAAGLFYSFALLFLALAMWQAFKVAIHFLVVSEKLRNILSAIFLTGAVIASGIHFIFPEIPRGSADGNWVFWHASNYTSLFYIFFAFIAGWTFCLVFIKNSLLVSETILKIRSFLFALPAFILPFAAFYYFAAQTLSHIYLAFFFSILGLLSFAAGHILIKSPK